MIFRRVQDVRVELILGNVLVLALIGLIVYFSTQSSYFLTSGNIQAILVNDSPLGVVVVPLTLLIIAGHVDLSIGSNAALSAMVAAIAVSEWHVPTGLAFVLAMVVGGAVGALNGTMCAFLKFNPIIVTLGMLGVLRGMTLLIHQEQVFGLGGVFHTIAVDKWLGIPAILWFVIGSFLFGGILIAGTPWGRYIYAIGTNPQAAFLSALPVRALPFALYIGTGAAAGLTGALTAARLDGVVPGEHTLNLELQALTVVLLGGVAFAGGRGRLFGVFVAWLFLATLQDGLVVINVTPYAQEVASGAALVFAAALDALGVVLGSRLQERRRVAGQAAPQAGEPGGSSRAEAAPATRATQDPAET